jgi:hypothetical protein
MTQDMIIYVCSSAQNAQTAQGFLTNQRYRIIFSDQVGTFTYDAVTYGGGANDVQNNQWVVIGTR